MSHVLKALLSVASPAGPGGRLSVLIFHRILAEPDPMLPDEPDAELFDALLGWLRQCFHILPVDEAIRRLRDGGLPARAAAITFDDGYADNFTVAMPILQRHGLSAAFFIATGFLDGGRMWNDTVTEAVRASPAELDLTALGLGRHATASLADKRRAAAALIGALKYLPFEERLEKAAQMAERCPVPLRNDLMMTSGQVQLMRQAGMVIGAHTVHHPILLGRGADFVRREIAQSRARLQDLLGEPIPYFAYPNGKPDRDYDRRDVEILRELGVEAAFSTAWGTASHGGDLLQIPRFTPWDRTGGKFSLRMLRNIIQSRLSLGEPVLAGQSRP